MRYHSAYRELALRVGDPSREIVAPETLVAVRLEPVLRNGKGSAILDLHFRRDARRSVIPLVIVDVPMLEARERDPLVWPEFAREYKLDDFGIAQRVAPWINDVFRSHTMNRGQWRILGDPSDTTAFEVARTAGFLRCSPV